MDNLTKIFRVLLGSKLQESKRSMPIHPINMANAKFFERGWLRMSAKIYAGKSSRDMGKAYSRLRKSSDAVRMFDSTHSSVCLPEVHQRANDEFNLNIYL